MLKTSGTGLPLRHFFFVAGLLAGSTILIPLTAHAALDYQTYVVQKNDNYVYQDSLFVDSISTSYVLTDLGSVSLEASSLTLTSKGSYLEIVEEGTLSGNLENRPDNSTQDFLFQGSLPIPPNAAVRGLEVYHDDTLFTSTLKPMVYSLNDVFPDSAALAASLNDRVAYLQQLTDQDFEATFAKAALGEPITVRLRYELPLPGSPTAPVTIPLIFQPSGQTPATVSISFFEDDSSAGAFQWVGPSGQVTLHDKDIHTVAYSPSFVFQRLHPPHTVATLQTTDFSAGDWSGHYLLLKAGLDDSIMTLLSHPMETVFLWRWNNPADFITTDGNGLKTLSGSGMQAADQAKYMAQVAKELAARGYRFGLLHVIDGRDTVFFPPAAEGDTGFTHLLAYLGDWNTQTLYAAYQNAAETKPSWAPIVWTDSSTIAQSQADFLAALNTIQKSFQVKTDLHHILLLSAGDAVPTNFDLTDPAVAQTVLDSTTIAASDYYTQWPGINLNLALAIPNAAPLVTYTSIVAPPDALPYFSFPVFQPTSVEYRAFTQNRVHAVDMSFDLGSQTQVILKATTSFGDRLELQGIDLLGRNTRLLTLAPPFASAAADSGLPRLWAADPNRIFENTESNLGMRYGILSKGSYFSAGAGSGVLTGPDGNPIIAVRSVAARAAGSPFRIVSDFLVIQIPISSGMVLQAYDLRGRRLFSVPLDAYRYQNGYRIPLSLFRKLGLSRISVTLRYAGKTSSFTLWLGGAK